MGLLAVLLEQTVKSLLLANSELARLDTGVVHTKERVDIVHGLGSDISKLLNLSCGILDL